MSPIQRVLHSWQRLPLPLQRFMLALRSPRSPLFKIYLLVSGERPSPRPAPTELPNEPIRVYIAPVNSAEQATLWAQALNEHAPGVGARNLVAPIVGGSAFTSTPSVPLGAFHLSRTWQNSEFERAAQFTHVLIESGQPIFGGLFNYSVAREARALLGRGVSIAVVCHGSDVRNTAEHALRTPWSPFTEPRPETALIQFVAERNRKRIQALNVPIFVSTPDLLDDLPGAHWCPLVVDPAFVTREFGPVYSAERLVVTHIPSRGWLKGTDLIEPITRQLDTAGVISYQPLSNVPRAVMPDKIGAADVVLEQFRLGSYGATAVEAMAAGRVVVGHVMEAVREHITEVTGAVLPIVEATPETLERVLRDLAADPARVQELSALGRAYVEEVHSGSLSAEALRTHWLDLP